MKDVGIFYGNLVCIYFHRFGMVYQEKSGNPGCTHFEGWKKIPKCFSVNENFLSSDCIVQAEAAAGLPDFSWYNIPNREKYILNDSKIYQMTVNGPNGHRIDQHLPLQDRAKFTQIGIFGLKLHLPSGNPGLQPSYAFAMRQS
jgi:hypothetical protein